MDGTATPTGLKSLPSDARPREKLLARGPAALSDAELLALLLRTGMAGKHVLQLAQELLDRFGGVGGLLHTGADALKTIKGLGPAKRAEVVAVLELARRALAQELQQRPLFDSPAAVRQADLQQRSGGASGDPEGFSAVCRVGPHCMKMMGCRPSRRIGVAVNPRTYFALARFRIASKENAERW